MRACLFQVWVSWTAFEIGINEIGAARNVFDQANKALINAAPDVRLLLLETWRDFEAEHGDDEARAKVQKLMPGKLTKRRRITTADGADAGFEEYYEYIFPDGKGKQTKKQDIQLKNSLHKLIVFSESRTKNRLLELAKRHREALQKANENPTADADAAEVVVV